jgi:hypothetical protein
MDNVSILMQYSEKTNFPQLRHYQLSITTISIFFSVFIEKWLNFATF